MALSATGIGSQIANSHTVFNVGSSMVFLLFVNLIVKLVERLVPGKVVKVERGVKFIDDSLIKMPQLALVNAEQEVKRLSEIVDQSFLYISQVITGEDESMVSTVMTQEKFVDKLYLKINDYLVKVSEHEFDSKSSEKLARLMHCLTDLERTNDHLNKVAEYSVIKQKKKVVLTEKEMKLVGEFTNQCHLFYKKSIAAFFKDDLKRARQLSKKMKDIQLSKAKLLKKIGSLETQKGQILQKIIHNIERAAHHGENLTDIVVSGF